MVTPQYLLLEGSSVKYQILYDAVKNVNTAIVLDTETNFMRYIGFAVITPIASSIYEWDQRETADDIDAAINEIKLDGAQYVMLARVVDNPQYVLVGECHVFSDREYAAGYADGSGIGWYYDLYANKMINLRRARV
jgi:hypothetical protein